MDKVKRPNLFLIRPLMEEARYELRKRILMPIFV